MNSTFAASSGEKRSKLPLVLWLATAVFIVYGTTIPFRFVSDPQAVAQHVSDLRQSFAAVFASGQHVSGPDFVSNIWLFTPFGCFGIWALGWPRSRVARALLLTALSCALSAGVETLQLFTSDRISSAFDIVANTIGGGVGAVGGIVLRSTVGTLLTAGAAAGVIQRPTFYPLIAALILVCAGAWEPFDPTLDVGSIAPRIRSLLHDPMQRGPLSDEGVSIMQHLFFSAALLLWLKELRVRTAAALAAGIGVGIAVALEASQMIIGSRMPGLWDAAVGAVGALLGVPIALAYSARRYSPIWPVALIVATLIAAAMQQLGPFEMIAEPRPFQWIPFLNYYEFTTAQTVSHSAELLLTYLPLGFGLALSSDTRARWMLPLGVAFAIAAPVEYLQSFIGGRYPDVTDIAMSMGGAWIGVWAATNGWRLFAADMKVISSHPTVTAVASRSRTSTASDLS